MFQAISMFWSSLYALCFAVNETASALAEAAAILNDEAKAMRLLMASEATTKLAAAESLGTPSKPGSETSSTKE